MDVSIIIVSFNTCQLLDDCLASVLRETNRPHEIIVVDNASTDDSLEMLQTKYPNVQLICNHGNAGFAKANNLGLGLAEGKYMLLLNPDTIILDGAIDRLVSFMEHHPEAGICSPKNVGADYELQLNCDYFPSLWNIFVEYARLGCLFPRRRIFNLTMMRHWNYDGIREVERVTGCSLLLRRELFDAIGDLDDNFFMYFEETDYCYRAQKRGFKTFFYPESVILHYGGQSAKAGKLNHIYNTTAMNYYLPSRYYFFNKHYGRMAELCIRLLDFSYGLMLYIKAYLQDTDMSNSLRSAKARLLVRSAIHLRMPFVNC